jgi:sulfane dehydrogenase subunit SoxC
VAWSGRGRIARVEISVDRGETWRDALLQEPILSKCFTRFQLMWQWQGETTVLMSRATDETGYVQPTAAALREARGVGTRYHYNHIRAWTVSQDGTVEFGVRV